MIRALPFVVYSEFLLAHPGHGKLGLLHFHEFSDGLLMVVGLVAVALLWLAWKK